MEHGLTVITQSLVAVIHAMALTILAGATLTTFVGAIGAAFAGVDAHARRAAGLHYAGWLITGLTFLLAAGMLEASTSADWKTLGKLAAIALIRTFLNYFLERDLERLSQQQPTAAALRLPPMRLD